MSARLTRSSPFPLGVSIRDGHANVAIQSGTADIVKVCLYDDGGREMRTVLPERTGLVYRPHSEVSLVSRAPFGSR